MSLPPQPLHLFAPDYQTELDTSTQVDRMPPRDAPCLCGRDDCAERGFPFCEWPETRPESEDE